jgi:hypothetical protein
MTTIEKDKGFQALMGQIDIMGNGPRVEVGFFAGNKPDGAADGDLSIAEYMFVNEVGTDDDTIPARPVMGATADAERASVERMIDDGLNRIALGKADVKKVLTLVGMTYQGRLREAIVDWSDPPNAESTQFKKGGQTGRMIDNPLFDLGTAANSVQFQVKGADKPKSRRRRR